MAYFLGTLFIIICILLVLVVLLQKGRGGGLGAAFGGAGGSAFGARTGDVFTWVTIVLTGLFLLLAIGTALVFRPEPGTVAMPSFEPSPSPISETLPVSIRCETPNATIYYTLDASEPSEDSTKYEQQAVPVEPDQTLKARAYRPEWNASPVAVGEYPDKNATRQQPEPEPETALEPADEPTAPDQPTTEPDDEAPDEQQADDQPDDEEAGEEESGETEPAETPTTQPAG